MAMYTASEKRVFETVRKAAHLLGLSSSERTDLVVEISEMFSEGVVTTEGLRSRIGAILPGTFGIMAEALGVAVGDLDKMLKEKKVFSAEALPKFADTLKKVYSLK